MTKNIINGLSEVAKTICKEYSALGAFVIIVDDKGVRFGTSGLDNKTIRDALCLGIHYACVKDEEEIDNDRMN